MIVLSITHIHENKIIKNVEDTIVCDKFFRELLLWIIEFRPMIIFNLTWKPTQSVKYLTCYKQNTLRFRIYMSTNPLTYREQ